jgi:4-hydroxybenzoate polyprenyltransferase
MAVAPGAFGKLVFLLRASRPAFWPVGPILFVAGLLYSHAEPGAGTIVQALMLSVPLCLFIFGVNDAYDYASDKRNARKGLVGGAIAGKDAREVAFFAGILCAALMAIVSIFSRNAWNFALVVAALLLGYAYSAPPIRLKERPPLDSLSNGLGAYLLFAAGFSFGGEVPSIPAKIAFAALAVAGMHGFSSIADYGPDLKARHRTIAVAFGKRTAALFAACCALCALFFGGFSAALSLLLAGFGAGCLSVAAVPDERLARGVAALAYAGFIVAMAVVLLNLGVAAAL